MNPSSAPAFPAIPLFTAPAVVEGWHQVRAPGGYETWRFDAHDAAGEYRCVAELIEGCCYHRGYHAAYRAFLRRPTRLPPPLPSQWPCVHFSLYRRAERLAHFIAPHAAEEFEASECSGRVSIGSCRATPQPDGSIHLALHSPPSHGNGTPIAAALDFRPLRPLAPPLQSPLFPRPHRPLATPTRWGGEHWWLAPLPLCDVSGSVQWHDPNQPNVPQVMPFAGRGFHDRAFGTAPPGHGLMRMMRGWVLFPDRTLAFQLAIAGGSRRTIAHLLQADMTSASIRSVAAAARWDGRTAMQMRFPTRLSFDGSTLEMVNPTVLAAEPHALHLEYEVASGGGATAFCEIVYPRRLHWSAMNRLLLR